VDRRDQEILRLQSQLAALTPRARDQLVLLPEISRDAGGRIASEADYLLDLGIQAPFRGVTEYLGGGVYVLGLVHEDDLALADADMLGETLAVAVRARLDAPNGSLDEEPPGAWIAPAIPGEVLP